MKKLIFAFALLIMPYVVSALALNEQVEVNICDTCEVKNIEELQAFVEQDINSGRYQLHQNHINYIINVDFDELYYNDKIFDYIYLDEYNTLNSWQSKNENVARVDNNMIIPVGTGDTTIVSNITTIQRPRPPECGEGTACVWPSYYLTYTFVVHLIDEKPELNINVNSKDNIVINIGDMVDIDVSLKYQSFKTSTDNTISIKIPSWLQIDESNISNGGKVLGESIVWNIDRLSQNQEITLHASAKVLESGKELDSLKYELTSVLSSNVLGEVESNKVLLNLNEKSIKPNPKTGDIGKIVFIIFMISGIIYLFTSSRFRKINT